MYFASQDDDDIEKLYSGPVDPSRKQFATLQEAIDEAEGKNDDFGYGSEYGWSFGPDVIPSVRHELHEEVSQPFMREKFCSCGMQLVNETALYKHQADALREQLMKL